MNYVNFSKVMIEKGKYNFQVEDWSKIKYIIKCNWGVMVDHTYPAPQIITRCFETKEGIIEFMEEYKKTDSMYRQIYYAIGVNGASL